MLTSSLYVDTIPASSAASVSQCHLPATPAPISTMDSSHDSNSNLESEDSSLEEVGGQLDLAFSGEDSTEDVPEDDGSPPAKRRGKAKRYQFQQS